MNKIIHGNCLQILKEMPDDSINLIVTDTPYGIQYQSNHQHCDNRGEIAIVKDRPDYFDEIHGDDTIPVEWLPDAYRILKNNTAIYVFCHWSKWHILHPAVTHAGFICKNMIVLNKSNHGMGDLQGQYAPKHELLLFATKGRHILSFDKRTPDIWNVPVQFSGAKRFHPNEKPFGWLAPCILNSSKPNDLVLDPFAGSGSTGIVAKYLGRQYCMIEIDAKYVDVIQKRLNSKEYQ